MPPQGNEEHFLYNPGKARRLVLGSAVALLVLSVLVWTYMFTWGSTNLGSDTAPQIDVPGLIDIDMVPSASTGIPTMRPLGFLQLAYGLGDTVVVSDSFIIEVIATSMGSEADGVLSRKVDLAVTAFVAGVTTDSIGANAGSNAISLSSVGVFADETFPVGERIVSQVVFLDLSATDCAMSIGAADKPRFSFQLCK